VADSIHTSTPSPPITIPPESVSLSDCIPPPHPGNPCFAMLQHKLANRHAHTSCTHMHALVHTHACTKFCMHTHTHMKLRTHIHIHTQMPVPASPWSPCCQACQCCLSRCSPRWAHGAPAPSPPQFKAQLQVNDHGSRLSVD